MSMYGGDVAEIYDLIHEARGKDFGAEAALVTSVVRDHKPEAVSLLDVACGTGAHLSAFKNLWPHVEGLELSPSMVDVARERVPGVEVHQGDMRDFDLGRTFDAVTCMFGSTGYMADVGELSAALRRFAAHLAPGGVVLIEPWWFSETFIDGYVAGGTATIHGRTVARVSSSVREGNVSVMDVQYLVADGEAGIRHLRETHRITLFTRAQYEAAFAAAGLQVMYISGVQQGRGLFAGFFA